MLLNKIRLILFLLYLLALSIWIGGIFYEIIAIDITWFIDPMRYISHELIYPVPDALNPWPASTALLILPTVACFVMFIKYKGKGKIFAIISFIGTILIIIMSLSYFVPMHQKIFTETGKFNLIQIEAMSRGWVVLNFGRLLFLMGIYVLGLIGLYKHNTP